MKYLLSESEYCCLIRWFDITGLVVRNSSREWTNARVISLARAIAQVKIYIYIYTHNHVDFGSNIKNNLAMALVNAKKQPHNAKSFMKTV